MSFGTFSGAALFLGLNNAAKVTMYQCSTESNTGCGYFCIDSAGYGVCTVTIDSCEVVYSCIANPFTSCIGVGGPTKLIHTWFENTFSEVSGVSDVGPKAQPLSFNTSGNLTIEGCHIYGEEYQIPIFYSGNELLGSYFGSDAHPGTNRTHAWTAPNHVGQQRDEFPSLKIRLRGNVGTDKHGAPIPLPDIDYMPTSLFGVGPLTNPYAPGAIESYRAEPRTTTTLYQVDHCLVPNGGRVHLFVIQPKTIINHIIIECTGTFSSATTISGGTGVGSYTDVWSRISIPPAGNIIVSLTPTADLVGNTWAPGNLNLFAVTLPPETKLTAGHLSIYVTMDVVL